MAEGIFRPQQGGRFLREDIRTGFSGDRGLTITSERSHVIPSCAGVVGTRGQGHMHDLVPQARNSNWQVVKKACREPCPVKLCK